MQRRTFLSLATASTVGSLISACGSDGSSSSDPATPASSVNNGTTTAPQENPTAVNNNPSGIRNFMSYAQRAALPLPTLPSPEASGIEHIVLVTMENRSFDHFLGWAPGVQGVQENRSFTDAFGKTRASFAMSKNPAYGYQGCGFADPNHSYESGRKHLNNGKMDGFLLSADTNKTEGDLLPIGYYTAQDLDFHRQTVLNYTICDYYFSGILSETYPNRIYLHCGATDRLSNTMATITLPTIWDKLAEKNVSARYYFSDIPFTALFGQKLLKISAPIESFFVEAKAGQLPSFSMIDPRFGGEDQGLSNDDHPHADVRNGQLFLNQIYDALRNSPQWDKTLMVVVCDEWGGFADHVAPPTRVISAAEQTLGNDGKLGFRTPCMLIGPKAAKANVSRFPFDPSSIHKLLEWRFKLNPLGARGVASDTFNLAYALDFTSPARTDKPSFTVANGPFGLGCPTANSSLDKPLSQVTVPAVGGASTAVAAVSSTPLGALLPMARSLGFPL